MKWPDAFREPMMVKVSGTEFGENEARRSIYPSRLLDNVLAR